MQATGTPQRINGRRRHLTREARRRAVRVEVAAHKRVVAAHVAAGFPQPTNHQVLAAAATQLGKPYCLAGCRCQEPGNACGCRDCSGEICFACNEANRLLGNPTRICTSSFGFAQVGRDAGRIIPKAQALLTPGAIGIRCPFCDPNGNGSNGHVWFCKGNGGGPKTSIEEGGHATGCYEGDADKPGDVIYVLLSNVLYVPQFTTEATMFTQQHHYDDHGNKRPVEDPAAIVYVSDDGLAVECDHSASIDEDQPVDHTKPRGRRRWTAPHNPLPGGVRFVSVAFRAGDSLDSRDGGVARCSDGTVRRFHLS